MLNKNKFEIILTCVVSAVFLIIFYFSNILFILLSIIVIIISTVNKKYNLAGLQLIMVSLLVAKIIDFFLPNIDVVIVLLVVLIIQVLNYITTMLIQKQEYEKFIEKKILIAKRNMIETNNTVILITRDNDVIWANENAYDEFVFLQRDQSLDFINDNVEDGMLEYANKYYRVIEQEDIYYLTNVTQQEREHKKLTNLQVIIGLIQIDNHAYLEQTMDRSEFLEMDTKIKLLLIDWFKLENIYYQQIGDDRFQINIPYLVLQKNIEEKFPQINKIIEELKESEFDVSLSMGIAYNYNNNLTIGQMANEALELANSRGGAQTVIFNNNKKLYFGGKISNSNRNIGIRSRFVYNTIEINAQNADVIYLMSHNNADYDALSSMVMVANLLVDLQKDIKIMLDKKSKKIILNMAKDIIDEDMLYYDTVVDKTKKNLLIVVDTQAKEILSHPKVYEEVNDCIVIDHHQTPENYIDSALFSWVEPIASSTTELISNMYLRANKKLNNKSFALLGLLAIITDTNNLKFRIASGTIDAIGFLIGEKATILEATELLEISKEEYLLKKKLLQDIDLNKNYAILEMEHEINDDLHAMIANEIIEIKEMFLVIVISKIATDKYKVKIRSNGKVNSKMFIEEFGGGGHSRQAAGIFSKEKISLMKEKIDKLQFEKGK